jgi:hypothetical protein
MDEDSLRPSKIATNLVAILLDRETTEYTEYTEYTEKRQFSSVYSVYSVVFHILSVIGLQASTLVLVMPGEDLAMCRRPGFQFAVRPKAGLYRVIRQGCCNVKVLARLPPQA